MLFVGCYFKLQSSDSLGFVLGFIFGFCEKLLLGFQLVGEALQVSFKFFLLFLELILQLFSFSLGLVDLLFQLLLPLGADGLHICLKFRLHRTLCRLFLTKLFLEHREAHRLLLQHGFVQFQLLVILCEHVAELKFIRLLQLIGVLH